MKVVRYPDVTPTHFDNESAKAVDGRVIIGKKDGAENFFLRVFEIGPGGHTPKHAHDWEHEIFFHAGRGEIFGDGMWRSVEPGSVAFVPPNAEHQIRNAGESKLVFACLIPSKAPEL
ncbi:MAG TPA: cupin domain-containing protein [Spirochaetia bacterium]|nr:cupin domain-containing protein [Spirochaetia bacterium]